MKRVARTEEEARDRALLENSIERVINTTIRILETIEPKARNALAEDVFVNLDDWKGLKTTVVHVWNEARNEAFKRGQKG